jgi:hypothetical protein
MESAATPVCMLESSFFFFELPFGPALRWRAHCLCAESQVMPVLERPLGLLPPNFIPRAERLCWPRFWRGALGVTL